MNRKEETKAHAVELIDYVRLVNCMADAGLDSISDVLFEQLRKLGEHETNNKTLYFWIALFNTAKSNDMVWLWLCSPLIRKFASPHAVFHTMSKFDADIPLSVIEGPDDEVFQLSQICQYPLELGEANFQKEGLCSIHG